MKTLSNEERYQMMEELRVEFNATLDSGRRNLLFSHCPFCGHKGGKYGIYVGADVGRKRFGMSNCFYCNRRFRTLSETLKALGREDMIPKPILDMEDDKGYQAEEFNLFAEEVDDSLYEIELPRGYKRSFKNRYLKSRGWLPDDFSYFEAGTNRGIDRRYEDYVILPIRNDGILCGFVARHTWSKDEIDDFNDHHRFQIRRYMNSTDNEFSKLLYNYDAIEPFLTDTVVLCEGAMDVVALVRKLELYDNKRIVPVATFGHKVSDVQIYKLQSRGVRTVVLGYDCDDGAIPVNKKISQDLEQYFDVLIADLSGKSGKDWDEVSDDEVYDVFCNHLLTVREYNLKVE